MTFVALWQPKSERKYSHNEQYLQMGDNGWWCHPRAQPLDALVKKV
jgi:hypothetical protein